MKKMFLFLAVVSFALTMSAKNQFTEISANGDTIQLFGYANIVKVKKCKYETFVSCTNTFFNKKTRNVKEIYENDKNHFMRFLSVGDTVDFYNASAKEVFDYDVIRIRISEKAMFWFDVPKQGSAKIIRKTNDCYILDNGTIVVRNKKENQEYEVEDVVSFNKTSKPFLVKIRKRAK